MDRPILFSAPMVRALLAGTKTQTRRLIPQATQDAYDEYDDWCRNVSAGVPSSRQWESDYYLERSRIQPGDREWVLLGSGATPAEALLKALPSCRDAIDREIAQIDVERRARAEAAEAREEQLSQDLASARCPKEPSEGAV